MLKNENCSIPKKGAPSLSKSEIENLRDQVEDWEVKQDGGVDKLSRSYKFRNFIEALYFTNQVGEIAEQQDHHPALLTEWGKVTVTWWTHAVNGLHRNDFIMAVKTDALYDGSE
jgi:4a-hydroxytetrahydrobiopterin dehydratase